MANVQCSFLWPFKQNTICICEPNIEDTEPIDKSLVIWFISFINQVLTQHKSLWKKWLSFNWFALHLVHALERKSMPNMFSLDVRCVFSHFLVLGYIKPWIKWNLFLQSSSVFSSWKHFECVAYARLLVIEVRKTEKYYDFCAEIHLILSVRQNIGLPNERTFEV